MESDSKGLIKNTAIYAIGDIIPKLLSFVVFPVLTSYLSPADYGIVNYVNTFNLFFSIIGLLCLNTYYLVYYYRQSTEADKRNLLGNLSIFILGLNFILSVIVCISGAYFPNLLSDKITFYPYLFIGIVTNFFNLMMILPSALYRLKEKPLPLTILNVLRGVLTTVLTVVLVVYFEFTAEGVLYSTMFITIVFGVVFLLITIRNMNFAFNLSQIYKALLFSLPLLPGSIAYYLLSMSDRFFIERYLDLTQLGIYSTASTLAMILNILAYGAYKAFEPYFFKIYGKEGFSEKFYKIQNYYGALILMGSMGITIFAQDFFRLFASEYYQTVYWYVPLVELGVVFSSFSMLYSTVITASGKTKINSMNTIIGGIVSCVINIVLLPQIGLFASCCASSVSFGMIMLLSIWHSGLRINIVKLVWAFIIASIFVFLCVYCIKWTDMLISMIVKLTLFFFVSFLLFKILQVKFEYIVIHNFK